MAYRVKDIFLTVQGEGYHSGRVAAFVRFAGCNLWSGREADRPKGPSCSRWCDTDFVGGDEMTARDIAARVTELFPTADPFVVLTGGEPLLQVDHELVGEFHRAGCRLAVETNGTVPVAVGVDWVTVSPKFGAKLVQQSGNELKLVYPHGLHPGDFAHMRFGYFYLQPLDNAEREENTRRCVEYVLKDPRWRISLQTHKALNVP
jgi:7-carboxy-7-deazaguanine synthase (Cx14CxxC type)